MVLGYLTLRIPILVHILYTNIVEHFDLVKLQQQKQTQTSKISKTFNTSKIQDESLKHTMAMNKMETVEIVYKTRRLFSIILFLVCLVYIAAMFERYVHVLGIFLFLVSVVYIAAMFERTKGM